MMIFAVYITVFLVPILGYPHGDPGTQRVQHHALMKKDVDNHANDLGPMLYMPFTVWHSYKHGVPVITLRPNLDKEFLLIIENSWQHPMKFPISPLIGLIQDGLNNYTVHPAANNDNNVTEILKNGEVIASYNTPIIVPEIPGEFLYYWVTWKDQTINFGKGEVIGEEKVLSHSTTQDIEVSSISLAGANLRDFTDWHVPLSYVAQAQHSSFTGACGGLCKFMEWDLKDTELSKTFQAKICANLQICFDTQCKDEIVIGYHVNKTIYKANYDVVQEISTPGILNCDGEWQSFWATWQDKKLAVGHGTKVGEDTIITTDSYYSPKIEVLALGQEIYPNYPPKMLDYVFRVDF